MILRSNQLYPRRLFTLSADDIARINPNTRTLPVFRTRQDAELTKAIYRRVPVLVNEARGENPWGVRFLAMFHMSNDSHLFRTRAELEAQGYRLVGNVFVKADELERIPKERRTFSAFLLSGAQSLYLPLYEAKMIWHYDHRFGTYEGVTSRSSTQLPTPDDRRHADPSFVVQPWYWVPAHEVEARLGEWKRGWLLGFRDVTNATNERTAVFSLLPRVGANHKVPLVLLVTNSVLTSCWYANVNSLVFDFVTRQKIGGTSLGFFILRQLPVLPPSAYTQKELRFIVPRVLELVYTAWDMAPFAADVWEAADADLRAAIRAQWEANAAATSSHFQPHPRIAGGEGDLPPFRWESERRARLQAELDAYYARLYGLTRKQLRYILDPADLTARELEDILDPWEEVTDPLNLQAYRKRTTQSDFPGESFRVLKEKEMRHYGEYRTRRLVLEAWNRLEEQGE
nr:hypothetical protein [Ardenticatena maritima]